MATHSSILAWRIPWTEEPGRLHTVHGVARVGHNFAIKSPPHLLGLTSLDLTSFTVCLLLFASPEPPDHCFLCVVQRFQL